MRARNIFFTLVVAVLTLGLGLVLPLKLFEFAAAGVLEGWIAALLAALALVAAGVIGVVGLGTSFVLFEEEAERAEVSKPPSLVAYRARQRAMLEELDEAVELLREIRDILQRAGE